MTFKEALQRDIKSVFLNFDEFGEYHKINGESVLIIIDENELTEREKRVRNNEKGLYMRQLLFYVSAEDFGQLPSPDKVLTLDDKKYRITDAQDEGGIYSISLEAYVS